MALLGRPPKSSNLQYGAEGGVEVLFTSSDSSERANPELLEQIWTLPFAQLKRLVY